MPQGKWIHCLKLSTMWAIQSIRDLSIKSLAEGPVKIEEPLQQTLVEMEFRVPLLIRNGIAELVLREKLQFTAEEKNLLGTFTALQIHEVREEALASRDKRTWYSMPFKECPNDGMAMKIDHSKRRPSQLAVTCAMKCPSCGIVEDVEDIESMKDIHAAIEAVFPEA